MSFPDRAVWADTAKLLVLLCTASWNQTLRKAELLQYFKHLMITEYHLGLGVKKEARKQPQWKS